MTNPLLEQQTLPDFEAVQAVHIEPAIDYLLEKNRQTVKTLLENTKEYRWDNFVQYLEDSDDDLQRVWSIVSHLHSVADSDDLRVVYNRCLPKLSDYRTEMGQHERLFSAYESIAKSETFHLLTTAQKKVIENTLRDFHLSGIALDKVARTRYKIIQQTLSKLETQFEENLLDSTHAWRKLITNKDELAGLPKSSIVLAAQTAANEKQEGWLLTLDLPSYMPVMQYADSRSLRREIYEAYVTRASSEGQFADQWDNAPIMYAILQYRTEKAKLLGFDSYAHYSLAKKMAKTPVEVMTFLNDLVSRSKNQAIKDFEELVQFVNETENIASLKAWDIAYYSEKLRQKKLNLSQQALRPYFPVHQVLEGLFVIVQKLYGITIKQRDGVQGWHKDVLFFDVFAADGELCAHFYLDLYARQRKRGGAWMDECIVRRKTQSGIQIPVAYLVCNFTPPVKSKPVLLTHDDVLTLFHEFGHGLHHMLTRVEYSGVAGINGVAWDAVELPSQFMENWAWEKEALDLFARHIDTGEKINPKLYNNMIRARSFQAGMQMVRQLEFALFDFRLHLEFASNPVLDIQQLLDEVRAQVAVVKVPAFNRFQHSFSHIFAGGYAAGYYSYKWAEVLSADAFSKFEENGIFDKKTSKAFLQNILEQGGSRDPMELFIAFRGREPNIAPLLRHAGIACK